MRLAWSLEYLVKDRLIFLNANHDAEERVVVIDIDEASLSALGPWPWPRSTIADIVENLLGKYEVRGVGLDIVFPSPSDSLGDTRLAALAETAPLTLAQAFDFTDRQESIRTGVPVLDLGLPSLPILTAAIPAKGYIANHSGLSSAPCAGNIGIAPDSDGQVRSVPMAVQWNGGFSLLLPLAMLNCDADSANILKQLGRSLVHPRLEVAYPRAWSAYTVIPAQAILEEQVDPQILRGRWVLVGSSALGLNDRVTTPLGGPVAGVMVHAAIMTSLLDKAQASHAPGWQYQGIAIASVWIVLSLGLMGWAMHRMKAWVLLPLLVACCVGWFPVAAWLVRQEANVHVTSPLLALGGLFILIPVEWWHTQREQSRLLSTFANYVAPSVLKQMLRQGIERRMIPQYSEITVLCADMQNYSGLTVMGSLDAAAQLTRDFLHVLTDPLLAHEGTLDKYTGDGLVAFWGAPIAMSDHADKALRAAHEMTERVHQWNLQRQTQGLPTVRVRIGIESGRALVGDLGTGFRRTYTAVGDCINSASKLENAAKQYNHDIIVGPQAAQQIVRYQLMEVGSIQLAGHVQPVPLYTPLQASLSRPG